MQRRFQLIDVFSEQSLLGNPLAVVLDAEGLSTAEMQQITRWMNLSETTFLLSPTDAEADYRVRIFTLERELPFAGHPTLGTCHAWQSSGGEPFCEGKILQQCGAGLVEIHQSEKRLAFAAPPVIQSGPVEDATIDDIVEVLRIKRSDIVDVQWADNGPGWIAVLLKTADDVLAMTPAGHYSKRMDLGIVGPYPDDHEFAFELRAIFTDQHGTLREDPVTGSLNASVAQWLLDSDRATSPYVASQGTCIGRAGRIYVHRQDDTVWIGGNTTTVVEGSLYF